MSDKQFAGKVVLVTGATSGIGKACAQAFNAAGAKVAIVGRNDNALQSLTQELEAKSGEIDRKSTRLNSSHLGISYAVFCLKKKTTHIDEPTRRLATRRLLTPRSLSSASTPLSASTPWNRSCSTSATAGTYRLSISMGISAR